MISIFFLHNLGGSAREWSRVARRLGGAFDLVPIDLPGFGDAAHEPGYAVGDMADFVARRVRARAPQRWALVGHSMGAKVAAVVARYAEDGESDLAGLVALVSIAGSPPGPEPIDDVDRETMLGWFRGDATSSVREARTYVAKNSGPQLDAIAFDEAVEDALRSNVVAWRAWLTDGSREDWAERVAVLRTPTLAIAGVDDENLGPEAQRRLAAPHFANLRSISIANAKHLLPNERSDDIARAIGEHVRFAAYRELIDSDRVSRATREALDERARPDDPDYEPVALGAGALATLRALVERVVPQSETSRIDLAARIDRALASDRGDGWRFATLPADSAAYRVGLATLDDVARASHGGDFATLDGERQDALLRDIAAGKVPTSGDGRSARRFFSADQMKSWFEDVRADAVKLYVAHPQTLAAMGYSGIANGGDDVPKSGFVRVGLDDREAWEPLAAPEFPA